MKNATQRLYLCTVGTRKIKTEEVVLQALSEMYIMRTKWMAFAKLIENNNAAKIFQFVDFYKKKHGGLLGDQFMRNSNPNECINSRFKEHKSTKQLIKRYYQWQNLLIYYNRWMKVTIEIFKQVCVISLIQQRDFKTFETPFI